jgi:hypothetical protein
MHADLVTYRSNRYGRTAHICEDAATKRQSTSIRRNLCRSALQRHLCHPSQSRCSTLTEEFNLRSKISRIWRWQPQAVASSTGTSSFRALDASFLWIFGPLTPFPLLARGGHGRPGVHRRGLNSVNGLQQTKNRNDGAGIAARLILIAMPTATIALGFAPFAASTGPFGTLGARRFRRLGLQQLASPPMLSVRDKAGRAAASPARRRTS